MPKNTDLIPKQKGYIRNSIFVILFFLILYAYLFYYVKEQLLQIYCIVLFFVTIYTLFIISNYNFNFKSILRIAIILFSLGLYPFVLSRADIFPTVYLLYLPILIVIYNIYSYESVFIFCLFLILTIATTPFVSDFFSLKLQNITSSERIRFIIKLGHIVLTALLSLFAMYYFNLFKKIETLNTLPILIEENNAPNSNEEEDDQYLVEEDVHDSYTDKKYHLLYQEIIAYFEKSKPYKNPDFNIQLLAEILNTNTSYVSRAINLNNEKGFKGLLSYYRITQVKKNFLNNYQKKYTIQYIYTDAGFRHQASFNRTFKEIEGITPKEFIKQTKKIKSLLMDEG